MIEKVGIEHGSVRNREVSVRGDSEQRERQRAEALWSGAVRRVVTFPIPEHACERCLPTEMPLILAKKYFQVIHNGNKNRNIQCVLLFIYSTFPLYE